jgi:hypothetical protein
MQKLPFYGKLWKEKNKFFMAPTMKSKQMFCKVKYYKDALLLKYPLRILISSGGPISSKFGWRNRGKTVEREDGNGEEKFLNKF